MGVTPRRVLCYAPYNRWALHGMWEMTILNAAKLRGAEVRYVLCDGLYSDCDQFWLSHSPRPQNACALCQAQVTQLVAGMHMDFQWLGRYLTTDESREAERWARSLTANELWDATYGDWQVAGWVRSSVQTHFRMTRLDIGDPDVERALRSYVYSGLIACFALDRLIEESAPDVMMVFNARQSSTRIAFELARARNIRVITHERGPRHETLGLQENRKSVSIAYLPEYWMQWGDVPLTRDELVAVRTHMADREHGRKLAWKPFTAAPEPVREVRARVGLSADRPTWVLFTSSDDEIAADEERSSPFASQDDWIEATVEHARRNPDIDLVIRVHPNIGSRRSSGVNHQQLESMRRIKQGLPANALMIDADDEISSYSLMDMCSVGLVWASTVALELACKGKVAVVTASNHVWGMPFVRTVEDPSRYEELLDPLYELPPEATSPEIMRLALRFAYGFYFRWPVSFPLVEMPTPHEGRLAYTTLDALAPGRDAGLDRCVRILLDGEPICGPPTEAQRGRSTATEDEALAVVSGVNVLAFAGELINDGTLLEEWARVFGDRDDVTLLIETGVSETARLVDAVTRAGLDRDDAPTLVAGQFEASAIASVSAVFSRMSVRDGIAGVPRYEPATLKQLAQAL
ncbi:MAG: hypothetical protein ACLP01_02520 [Solirubrobacteraceae bacterium]